MVAALRIPVVSNGNTACHADVAANLAATGAAGVMSGEGVLSNPLLFETTPRGGSEGGCGEGGGGSEGGCGEGGGGSEGGCGEGGGGEGGGGEGGSKGGRTRDRDAGWFSTDSPYAF